MDEVKRTCLLGQGHPGRMRYAPVPTSGDKRPRRYSSLTIAYLLKPELCSVKPMRIRVDEKGFTRVEEGAPNAQVAFVRMPTASSVHLQRWGPVGGAIRGARIAGRTPPALYDIRGTASVQVRAKPARAILTAESNLLALRL